MRSLHSIVSHTSQMYCLQANMHTRNVGSRKGQTSPSLVSSTHGKNTAGSWDSEHKMWPGQGWAKRAVYYASVLLNLLHCLVRLPYIICIMSNLLYIPSNNSLCTMHCNLLPVLLSCPSSFMYVYMYMYVLCKHIYYMQPLLV